MTRKRNWKAEAFWRFKFWNRLWNRF